ncbi:MAG TPA: DUF58 domain-containing protein [Jatrophihabitans sp.]|jgi:uncharacterized protein (DUF58 family)
MVKRWGLTLRANCLLAAGLTALICGVAVGATDLVRAGALILALPVLTLLVVHRARLMLDNDRRVEPEQIDAGQSAIVHLVVRNNSRLPTGALMLEDQLPHQLRGKARFAIGGIPRRGERSVQYRIPALPRGRYDSGPLQVRLVDRFHLVDLMRSFTASAQLLVGPIIERLPGSEAPRSHDVGDNAGSHSVGTHGADDASTREYRVGDDLRKIHWRSSARFGSLMVRQEERPWQGRGALLLDLRADAHTRADQPDKTQDDPRDYDSMEWAISAAASIAAHMQFARQQIELVYGTSEHPLAAPAVRLEDPRQIRSLLAEVTPSTDRDLAACAVPLARSARDATLIAVLGTPDQATLHTLLEVTARRRGTTGIALVLDSPTWAGRHAERDAQYGAGYVGGPVQQAVLRLRAAGWHATVVEQGDTITDAWVRVTTGLAAGANGVRVP